MYYGSGIVLCSLCIYEVQCITTINRTLHFYHKLCKNLVRTIDFSNQTAMLPLSVVTFARLVLHLKLEALFLYLTNEKLV